jgi:RNA polymerase sigma factor (sigma-70 family)
MRVVRNDNESNYTDAELVNSIKEGGDGLDILYKKHKSYCINFMKSMYKYHEELKDIYHDAVVVLYEKINTPGFELTCSIQTYLNTVCRNQILKRINHSNRYEINGLDENGDFLESIKDNLEDLNDVNNERIQVMKQVFEQMKETSSKCYEIMVRFWYKQNSMEKIAIDLGYANARTVINLNGRCRKDFKIEVYKRLMSWAK